MAVERPEVVSDEYLVFLDTLREGGTINMFGAAAPLREMYALDRTDSRTVLKYWMDTFGSADR